MTRTTWVTRHSGLECGLRITIRVATQRRRNFAHVAQPVGWVPELDARSMYESNQYPAEVFWREIAVEHRDVQVGYTACIYTLRSDARTHVSPSEVGFAKTYFAFFHHRRHSVIICKACTVKRSTKLSQPGTGRDSSVRLNAFETCFGTFRPIWTYLLLYIGYLSASSPAGRVFVYLVVRLTNAEFLSPFSLTERTPVLQMPVVTSASYLCKEYVIAFLGSMM
jgi:hypothetical protein